MSSLNSEIRLETVGLSQLGAILRRLPDRAGKRILMGGVSAAAQTYVSIIRKGTPKRTGNLRRAWYKKAKWYAHSLTAFAIAKARRPQGAHANLVEAGSVERFTKTGVSRGRMPAFRPVGMARSSGDERIRTKLAASILKNAEKEIAKAIR